MMNAECGIRSDGWTAGGGEGMRRLVERLVAEGVRERFKVLIGGPPLSWTYCREIGADAYGSSAPEGVRLARELAGDRS